MESTTKAAADRVSAVVTAVVGGRVFLYRIQEDAFSP